MNSSKEILTLINNNNTCRWHSYVLDQFKSRNYSKDETYLVNQKYFRLFDGYASGFHHQHVSVFILNPQSISSIIHSWCTDNKFAWHMAPRRPPHLKTCTNTTEKIDNWQNRGGGSVSTLPFYFTCPNDWLLSFSPFEKFLLIVLI